MSCLVQSQISTWKPRSSIRRTRSVIGSSVKIISAQAARLKSAIIAPTLASRDPLAGEHIGKHVREDGSRRRVIANEVRWPAHRVAAGTDVVLALRPRLDVQEHRQPVPQADEGDQQPGNATVAVGEGVYAQAFAVGERSEADHCEYLVGGGRWLSDGQPRIELGEDGVQPGEAPPPSRHRLWRAQTPIFSRLPSFSRAPSPTS